MLLKKVLMCPPKYYNVLYYQMNHFMKLKHNVNKGLATYQWQQLYNTLYTIGVDIKLIEPRNILSEMVFCSNSSFIYNNKAIISNYTAPPRRFEMIYYDDFYKSLGYDTYKMKRYFEGTGDAIFSHNKTQLWVGESSRTCFNAYYELVNFLNKENSINYNHIKLEHTPFYQLDTCFCPINDNIIMLYEPAFSRDALKTIYNIYNEDESIKLDEEDAFNLVCNSIVLEYKYFDTLRVCIISHKLSNKLKQTLINKEIGFIENNVSEFILGGGGPKSLIVPLII